MRNKNFTTGLSMLGGQIKGNTCMKQKIKAAQQAVNESNFWHFCDTGEMLKEFDSLYLKQSDGYTIPEFDSENQKEIIRLRNNDLNENH